MIIMKFGGASIATADRIKNITAIILREREHTPVVVLSAIGDTTDLLLDASERALDNFIGYSNIIDYHVQLCKELGIDPLITEELLQEADTLLQGIALVGEMSPRVRDRLVSCGERLAVRIIAAYMRAQGFPAEAFDAWDIGMITNGVFGNADVPESAYSVIRSRICSVCEYNSIPVITGFIGKDTKGEVTTLGRGGSDLSAAIIGAAIGAAEIQVWKDVDGILSADPRIVSYAQVVDAVSFDEAAELAYFGAQVLHPRAMHPARRHSIPIRVKNALNPDHPGTVISFHTDTERIFKSVTCRRNITVIDIVSNRMLGQHGFLAEIFSVFDDMQISVDMITTSEVSVTLTLDNPHHIETLVRRLSEYAEVTVKTGKSLVSIIGMMAHSSSILEQVFRVLREQNVTVDMMSLGASKVNIGFVVNDDIVEQCVQAVHAAFFEEARV